MTKGLNGQLYLCGYNQTTYSNTSSRNAFICKYETPSTPTGIDWSNAVVRYSNFSNQYNYASKLAVNTNDGSVFISGTFGIDNFSFGATPLQLGGGTGTLYNHYAAKFNPTPTQLNIVWETGLGTFESFANSSGGNSMVYDNDHNMFYLGGAFNGQLGLNRQGYFNANSGNDAFVARFEDLGEAWYKNQEVQNPFVINDGLNSNLKVYPNPNNGIFNVSVSNNEQIAKVEITDMLGRQVYLKEQIIDRNDVLVDINQLAGNTYILTVTTESAVYTAKVLLMK